jgi:protein-S-isoprenylcysteine O-methyltransferase Ste14
MIYVLIQFLAFVILLSQIQFTGISILVILLWIISAIIGIKAIFDMQISNLNVVPELKEQHKLITCGIYKYMRHPMYLSIFIFFLSVVLTNVNYLTIITYIILVIDLHLKSEKEEFYLTTRFKDYKIYQTQTYKFLPKI